MKQIPLTKGQFAIVDDDLFDELNRVKWYAHADYRNRQRMYVVRNDSSIGKHVRMHRVIMNVTDPKIFVDHKNGNPLDNRRENLRLATVGQNNANVSSHKNSSSKYLGVKWHKGRWRAHIQKDRKQIYLGGFKNEKDAALAYDLAAKNIHGEFANPNFKECLADNQ